MRLLSLTDAGRTNCKVTFNVNRFEVYHAAGWMLTAAYDKADLQKQLSDNKIIGALFDSVAIKHYRK